MTNIPWVQPNAQATMGTPSTNGQGPLPPPAPVTPQQKPPSQATKLVNLATQTYLLGITPDNKPFACDPFVPHVALDLRGNKLGLRQQLSSDYFDAYDAAPSQNALVSAMSVLEGRARKAEPTKVWTRVAGNSEAIYIDMADADDRVIKIHDGTWETVDDCPYKFRRTENTVAMCEPQRKGKVKQLFNYLHVKREDRSLLAGAMIDALVQPTTAKPIVQFDGEHGTAKTSSTVYYSSVIDPTVVPHNGPPKDPDQWNSIASGSWIVALDNLSSIPHWLSDAMCRTATGTGRSTRMLYTDDGIHIATYRRGIVFNGISLDRVRGDFADRLVCFELERIPEAQRKSETHLQESWQKDLPYILGGLLNWAAKVHQMLPTLEPQPLPRMADFARVLICLDRITKSDSMVQYRSRLTRTLSESAADDPFIGYLIDRRYETSPAGETAGEILRAVLADCAVEHKPSEWPKTAKTLTTLLKRNAPGLRELGWKVEDLGDKNKAGTKRWLLVPPERPETPSGESGTEF